jgi:hypothetical protein
MGIAFFNGGRLALAVPNAIPLSSGNRRGVIFVLRSLRRSGGRERHPLTVLLTQRLCRRHWRLPTAESTRGVRLSAFMDG